VVSAGTMSSCPVAVEEAKTNMALSSTCGGTAPW
jgi:hypothetical protein